MRTVNSPILETLDVVRDDAVPEAGAPVEPW